MPKETVDQFKAERETLNKLVMQYAGQGTKRFYSLDSQAYREGALSRKTKELLGLATSAVLRCDDCIKYHLEKAFENGVSREEMMETLGIATLVGGTIVIPHLRRAYEFWEQLESN